MRRDPRPEGFLIGAPLIPASCDLRDFPAMMLECGTLRDSDFAMLANGDEFRAGVLLWAASWHQLPAANRLIAPQLESFVPGYFELHRSVLTGHNFPTGDPK